MHADRLEEEMNARARGERAVSVRSYDSRSSHARGGETQNTDRPSHSTSSRHHRSHRDDDDDDDDDRASSYSSRRRRREHPDPGLSPPRRERERERRSLPDDDDEEYRRRRRASYDRTDRERPRDLDRYERERERETDRRRDRHEDRDRDRDRDRDHYYPRDSKRRRSRSRDAYERPRRHRDDYDERDIPERRYPDDRRMREERRQRSPPRRRHSPSYDDEPRSNRRQRSLSPELDEEQREMRSIFVSQLSARVGDRELGIFFEHQAGKVREARVIVDRISRRSKGVGYVEFVELETVQKALTLSGTKLLGIPIAVQYTEAEKNRQAREPGAVAAGNAPPGGAVATQGQGQGPPNQSSLLNRLYVGSLNFALTDEDVRQVFQSFGEITRVDLHRDAITNKSKGYAFVQFKEVAHAQEALAKMNNFVLAGREIKVGLVGDRTMSANRGETQLQQEDGPLLNNISRIELMQKLARSDQPEEMDALKTSVPRPIIPTATTRNVVMANAFNPEEETEPDWDVELRDDVKEECQNSYGPILDIYVLKESKGEIYIRFGSVQDAIKAVAGLNGRFFGGNQITASHTSDQLFDAKK